RAGARCPMQTAMVRFADKLNEAFREGDADIGNKRVEASNVGVLEAQYRALSAGDFATALAKFADDIEFEILGPPAMPFAGSWRGRDEVASVLGHNFSQVADQEPEIRSVTAQGDTVVIMAREKGRYVPTGRTYDLNWVQVFQFRDGQVVRIREL